jgi:hypothetical protein
VFQLTKKLAQPLDGPGSAESKQQEKACCQKKHPATQEKGQPISFQRTGREEHDGAGWKEVAERNWQRDKKEQARSCDERTRQATESHLPIHESQSRSQKILEPLDDATRGLEQS